MPTETESRIIAIIQEMKNSQDIDPNTVLIDSGLLDSFDVITLLMKLEEVLAFLSPAKKSCRTIWAVCTISRVSSKSKKHDGRGASSFHQRPS